MAANWCSRTRIPVLATRLSRWRAILISIRPTRQRPKLFLVLFPARARIGDFRHAHAFGPEHLHWRYDSSGWPVERRWGRKRRHLRPARTRHDCVQRRHAGFSVNNIFDYSARFSTAAGQVYSFDTAGQSVTFTNAGGLTSSGGTLTKLAPARSRRGPSSYSGLTTVSIGRLVFQVPRPAAATSPWPTARRWASIARSTQVTPATLALGTSGGTTFGIQTT